MSTLAILGRGATVHSTALAMARTQSVCLGCPTPVRGPLLWRHADPETGEGVLSAIREINTLILMLSEPGQTGYGALLGARRRTLRRVVLALSHDLPEPSDLLPEWSIVRFPACWGPLSPLCSPWTHQAQAGRAIWSADPGPIPVVSASRLAATLLEALEHPGARWALSGSPRRLPELADAIARRYGVPVRKRPLGLALRRADTPRPLLQRWLTMPSVDGNTGEWSPPGDEAPESWLPTP